ncbi:Gypsy retrotransposon integrase-like protein 1 [Nosema granulosis]|uniref:Gypsy retrotransposon integrase-like protein 1 n=1 Tax=Nosema granulosis TaxID=83296 RepID=A0A9P6GXW5_9MICR|nr:Gypsy retrotransposon integrase-like protein 1 [Nosema granulosis]
MSKVKRIETENEREELVGFLKTGKLPEEYKGWHKTALIKKYECFIIREADLFMAKNDVLVLFCCNFQIEKKKSFILNVHLPGHISANKLEEVVFKNSGGFTRNDIRELIKFCESCQLNQSLITRPPMKNIIESAIMHRWIADTVDMSHYAASNDGYCWMLNIVDSYSKFAWSFPLKDKSMKTYAKTFKKLFFCEGP